MDTDDGHQGSLAAGIGWGSLMSVGLALICAGLAYVGYCLGSLLP